MKSYKMPLILVLASATLMTLFQGTSALAQDAQYSEEYMKQHDGGDRAEYLQEMENSDPLIYVAPVNDASHSTPVNNVPSN
jgi:hypothetical protein